MNNRSPEEFKEALYRADRTTEYSDDYSVYRRGRDLMEALWMEAESSPEKKAIYTEYIKSLKSF